jgi:pimeloyl-ACP methyl ester carboxylesterase
VIHPLRTGLPAAGWHTLSLQLPPAGDDPLTRLDTAQDFLDAAIGEMQRRNIDTLVLLGHGLGALALADYLAAGDNLAVRGVVAIGLDGRENAEPRLDGARQLAKVRPPVLDIYGSRDQGAVLDSAARRADLFRRRTAADGERPPTYRAIARDYSEKQGDRLHYRQQAVPAADHRFSHQSQLLLRRVRGWLQRHVGANID